MSIKLSDLINEGFRSNSGLAAAIRLYKGEPDKFPGSQSTIKKILDLKMPSNIVFQFSSLFPRDTFKIDYIRNGKLQAKIKSSYISDESKKLEEANVLRDFVLALDKFYGSKDWPSKF